MHRVRKQRGAWLLGREQMRTNTVILSMYLEMPKENPLLLHANLKIKLTTKESPSEITPPA